MTSTAFSTFFADSQRRCKIIAATGRDHAHLHVLAEHFVDQQLQRAIAAHGNQRRAAFAKRPPHFAAKLVRRVCLHNFCGILRRANASRTSATLRACAPAACGRVHEDCRRHNSLHPALNLIFRIALWLDRRTLCAGSLSQPPLYKQLKLSFSRWAEIPPVPALLLLPDFCRTVPTQIRSAHFPPSTM